MRAWCIVVARMSKALATHLRAKTTSPMGAASKSVCHARGHRARLQWTSCHTMPTLVDASVICWWGGERDYATSSGWRALGACLRVRKNCSQRCKMELCGVFSRRPITNHSTCQPTHYRRTATSDDPPRLTSASLLLHRSPPTSPLPKQHMLGVGVEYNCSAA